MAAIASVRPAPKQRSARAEAPPGRRPAEITFEQGEGPHGPYAEDRRGRRIGEIELIVGTVFVIHQLQIVLLGRVLTDLLGNPTTRGLRASSVVNTHRGSTSKFCTLRE